MSQKCRWSVAKKTRIYAVCWRVFTKRIFGVHFVARELNMRSIWGIYNIYQTDLSVINLVIDLWRTTHTSRIYFSRHEQRRLEIEAGYEREQKMHCDLIANLDLRPFVSWAMKQIPGSVYRISWTNYDIMNECEVCTRKYFPEVFVHTQATKERGLREKTEDRANEVNKTFITWLLVYRHLCF